MPANATKCMYAEARASARRRKRGIAKIAAIRDSAPVTIRNAAYDIWRQLGTEVKRGATGWAKWPAGRKGKTIVPVIQRTITTNFGDGLLDSLLFQLLSNGHQRGTNKLIACLCGELGKCRSVLSWEHLPVFNKAESGVSIHGDRTALLIHSAASRLLSAALSLGLRKATQALGLFLP